MTGIELAISDLKKLISDAESDLRFFESDP